MLMAALEHENYNQVHGQAEGGQQQKIQPFYWYWLLEPLISFYKDPQGYEAQS